MKIYRNSLNLFDKTNYVDLTGYYISNLRILYAAVDTLTLAFPCSPSTQYTVQRPEKLPRFAIAFSNTDQWASNLPLTGFAQNNNALFLTSTSDADSEYLLIYYGKSAGDGASTPEELQNCINGLMIIEGNKMLPAYEPYNVVDWYIKGYSKYSNGAWGTATADKKYSGGEWG